MKEVPSLITLCMEATKQELLRGDDILSHIYDLPPDLLDTLLMRLPPVALNKLKEEELPFRSWSDHESTDDCCRKRKRNENFNSAWMRLYKSRWPDHLKPMRPADCSLERHARECDETNDWQQMYWENHIQECLDEAAEIALLPYFEGCLGEMKMSDGVIKYIGYEEHASHPTSDYSKLSYHCQRFGNYARCLRLQNVLCSAETCNLLGGSKLQSLVLWRIKSQEHVDGLCKLLSQNRETLRSLEFIHCKLSSTFANAIRDSLLIKSLRAHAVQHFSVKSSRFLEDNSSSLPNGLVSFLSSGRSLCSLAICDNHGRDFAKPVFDALLDSSSSLSILDVSEKNISGWLYNSNLTSSSSAISSFGIGKSLQSLRVLNLRGNNLRNSYVESLRYALVQVPNLEMLDISDNPIEDDGIRSLIPYFLEASKKYLPLADLKLENCELSCNGVVQLLEVLSTLKNPLESLSLADNDLGSQVATTLVKFLGTCIKVLNIELIGLGSSGFLELEKRIEKEVKLVHINISKNRGGSATAGFLSKLISRAPELVGINAAYNFIPPESLKIICSALKATKGKIERLDLSGNTWCNSLDHASVLAEFGDKRKPILILPSHPVSNAPYDDDP